MKIIIDDFDSLVFYEENYVDENLSKQIIQEVIDSKPEQRQIKIYNRICNQRRLVKLFGNDGGFDYTYSRLTLQALQYPKNMNELKLKLEKDLGQKFPICLVNFYRDGKDYISPHSDDESDLGRIPIIVSISLGAKRRFILQNKINKEITEIELENNSLLVMAEKTQKYFKHSLPIDKKCDSMRINLTFRTYKK